MEGWQEMKDDEKVARVLDGACRNGRVRKVLDICMMWER